MILKRKQSNDTSTAVLVRKKSESKLVKVKSNFEANRIDQHKTIDINKLHDVMQPMM